jgi:hypothetical protein
VENGSSQSTPRRYPGIGIPPRGVGKGELENYSSQSRPKLFVEKNRNNRMGIRSSATIVPRKEEAGVPLKTPCSG